MAEPTPADYLGNIPFVVLDVETTGLDPRRGHRICEIALLRYQGGKDRILDMALEPSPDEAS